MSNSNFNTITIPEGEANQVLAVNGTGDIQFTNCQIQPMTYDIGFRGKKIKSSAGGDNSMMHIMIGTVNAIGWKALKAYEESNIKFGDELKIQIAQILLETDNTLTDEERFEMEELVISTI
jgi:hypothetical protein